MRPYTFVLPTSVSLRIRIMPTREQKQVIYLATRRAHEQMLAISWRIHTSTCNRCGYQRGEHALWCTYNDY